MRKITNLLFVAFFVPFLSNAQSKTGIAYLLPIDNVVMAGAVSQEGKQADYPIYQRWKIMLVNSFTLLPANPQNPETVVLYIKIKDAAAKEKIDSIIGVVKDKPVVLDGTLYKEKRLKKLRHKGDVEIIEAFQVDNWAPLEFAKNRIAEMSNQVLVDANKLDSALNVTDKLIEANEKLKEENNQLKKEAAQIPITGKKTDPPSSVPLKAEDPKKLRRKGLIEPVKPPGT